MYGAKGALEAAAEAAAKLDASLNIKKKIDGSELPKAFFKNTDVLKIIQAEYSINHCSQAVRNLLCKGATQEKIREACDAYVSTKGRYIPEGPRTPAEKNDKAFGLYLFIQGPNKRSVDLAIKMIEHINQFGGDTRQPPPLMSLSTTAPPPAMTTMASPLNTMAPPPQPTLTTMPPPSLQNLVPLQGPPPSLNLVEKVPIGIDRVLPGFNLPMKLIGQNGSNLQYIRNETGAIVTLRGLGSAFIEPTTGQEAQEILHFNIEHSKPEGIAAARDLALNLISTVQQEYAQYQATQVTVPQVTMDPNLVIHQSNPMDQQLIQQPLLTTSITLPVVQTASGFLPQANVAPPPQFSQPPPVQLNLPPPGVHIPQQTGPLVPPPTHPSQQLQVHQPSPDSGASLIQHQFQPGPQPQQQQQQHQYLITQSGQPVQGIVTSQGFVVLNQQPQQVFLSQPPGSTTQLIHQGQLAFQHAGQTAVTTPVSYQLQYVQQNQPPSVSGSPLHLQQQQQPSQQSQFFFQPAGQLQFQNGTVQLATQQQIVGERPPEGSGQPQQQLLPPGSQVVHMKPVQNTVQVMHHTQAPTVQYISSPGIRPEQPRPVAPKESRQGKRKFTEEAEPSPQESSPQHHSSAQLQAPTSPPSQHLMQQPPPPQHLLQPTQQPQMVRVQQHQIQHQQYILHGQQQIQLQPQAPYNPGQSPGPCPQPVPVPQPNQAMQQIRQGVGVQDLLQQQREQQPAAKANSEASSSSSAGKEGLDERQPPPVPAPGNQYAGQDQQQKTQQPHWYGSEQDQKSGGNNSEDYALSYARRDRHTRERPTFNHYSGKPQLYGGYQPYPPPPPPPPPQQHQSNYYYHRR